MSECMFVFNFHVHTEHNLTMPYIYSVYIKYFVYFNAIPCHTTPHHAILLGKGEFRLE